MYKSRGKIPFNESLFLELLPAKKKYTREKEALKDLPRDYREWMRKAAETFQTRPAERHSEQAVKRLLSRCLPALKEHLANLQAELKTSDDPLEANNLTHYVVEVEKLAAAAKGTGSLERYHALILEKHDIVRVGETKVEATAKSGESKKN